MPFDVERLLRLWTDPLPEDTAAAAAFREVYTDPVTVNGAALTAADLVARARVMQAALERPERAVVSVVEAGTSVALAFRLAGRQVGPLDTPAGRIPPTGQWTDIRIIDVLTLTDGRISDIWMVADWLTALSATGAVQVAAGSGTPAVRGERVVPTQYRAPGWFTRNVVNRAVEFLTGRGVSIAGSRVLAVRGRTSGAWRTTPVNVLDHHGRRYLVSPRGEGQWVRNLRAAGTGELRLGRRTEAFRGRELPDEEKVPVIRAYLERWKFEVGMFFGGVGPDSSDADILAIVGEHPVFEVLPMQ